MNKYQYITFSILILLAFATGRYFTPEKIVTKTNTVQVDHIVQNKDIAQKEQIVQVKKPDGTITTTTNIDTNVKDNVVTDNKVVTNTITVTETKHSTTSVNALLQTNIFNGNVSPIWGIQVLKQILGPIEGGVFVFQSGTVGCSLGIRW
jgi:hypothetical protein